MQRLYDMSVVGKMVETGIADNEIELVFLVGHLVDILNRCKDVVFQLPKFV